MTKEELLEKYRLYNVGFPWWETVHEEFKTDLQAVGICVAQICKDEFTGYVLDWNLFLRSLGYVDPVLIQHAKLVASFGVGSRRKNCGADFIFDFDLPESATDDKFIAYEPGDLRVLAQMAILSQYESDTLEEEFINAFEEHRHALQDRLDAEYAYLTSDEAVWESLTINEVSK